jgi:hypothetical protein
MGFGKLFRDGSKVALLLLEPPAGSFSSIMVFHSPHPGQRPTHLGDSVPQLLQNHAVFCCLAINGKVS